MTPTPLRTYLDECRALADAACPGPWRVNSVSDGIGRSVVTNQSHPLCELSSAFHRQCHHGTGRDAEFIAASREAIPRLLEMVEVALRGLEGSCYCNDPAYRGVDPCDACESLAELSALAGKGK